MTMPEAVSETRRPVRVLFIVPAIIPSTIIGVFRPLRTLAKRRLIRWRMRSEGSWTTDNIDWCDVVVFCRNQSPESNWAALYAKTKSKRLIFEIDDNFFDIPLSTAVGRYHRSAELLHTTRRLFELCDLTRVYTQPMREQAESFGANVREIRSYFDADIIKGAKRKVGDGKIRVAFATGRVPDPEIETAIDTAIVNLIGRYGSKLEFHFWRKPSGALRKYPEVVVQKTTQDYDKFVRSFYESGYDIGLAPIADTTFYRSKTNNKFREYGACGVVGIYSNCGAYASTVVNEQTGLFVGPDAQSWTDALARLIDNPDLRRSIASNAAREISENYNYESFVEGWMRDFRSVLAAPPRPTTLKPFYYERTIVTGQTRLGRAAMSVATFPTSWVRGGQWGDFSSFGTTIISSLDKDHTPQGKGRKLIVLTTPASLLNDRTLQTTLESGISLVLDARLASNAEVPVLYNRLLEAKLHHVVMIVGTAQAGELDIDGSDALIQKVLHPTYPRPEAILAPFGVLVIAPKQSELYGAYTLGAPQALWQVVMESVGSLYGLGKPEELSNRWIGKLPRGVQLALRNVIERGGQLNPFELVAAKWYRLRWVLSQSGLSDKRQAETADPPGGKALPHDE